VLSAWAPDAGPVLRYRTSPPPPPPPQDDVDLECSGNASGKCASRANMNFGTKGL
jgi:hypothetical protein